jgi:hypothetical protein
MTTQWIRSNDVVWEELDGEALLVSPSAGRRWTLNATATGIWKLCDGHLDLSGLAQRFSKVSRHEIAEFCALFGELGLLRESGASLPIQLTTGGTAFMSNQQTPPMFREVSLGSGPRRRPSPRGNSGPG